MTAAMRLEVCASGLQFIGAPMLQQRLQPHGCAGSSSHNVVSLIVALILLVALLAVTPKPETLTLSGTPAEFGDSYG